jgi:hypothetical protein
VGTADTASLDPNFPNSNPLLTGTLAGVDPFIFHARSTCLSGLPVSFACGVFDARRPPTGHWISYSQTAKDDHSVRRIFPLASSARR